jgi:hypothetical protein
MLKGLAAERFPGDPKAFAKFVNGEGAELNTSIVRAEHAAQQHQHAVGDGYTRTAVLAPRNQKAISATARPQIPARVCISVALSRKSSKQIKTAGPLSPPLCAICLIEVSTASS